MNPPPPTLPHFHHLYTNPIKSTVDTGANRGLHGCVLFGCFLFVFWHDVIITGGKHKVGAEIKQILNGVLVSVLFNHYARLMLFK